MLTTDTSLGIFDRDNSALPGFVDAAAANSLMDDMMLNSKPECIMNT